MTATAVLPPAAAADCRTRATASRPLALLFVPLSRVRISSRSGSRSRRLAGLPDVVAVAVVRHLVQGHEHDGGRDGIVIGDRASRGPGPSGVRLGLTSMTARRAPRHRAWLASSSSAVPPLARLRFVALVAILVAKDAGACLRVLLHVDGGRHGRRRRLCARARRSFKVKKRSKNRRRLQTQVRRRRQGRDGRDMAPGQLLARLRDSAGK
mmetsp:Transcript_17334/g.66057  ORF Transcript_17334/g.66057 Transcript_17334/m.66057 type:complete len:210 (+) Transcript_17334:1655-2284(+)